MLENGWRIKNRIVFNYLRKGFQKMEAFFYFSRTTYNLKTMDHSFIRNHRLKNQQLTETNFSNPEKLVSHFGAMQAQDYAMAKWAIGLRTGKAEKDIEYAINEGKIIRTHILRPTWHFVAAEDIYWMLELTAPNVKGLIISAAAKIGIEESHLNNYNEKLQRLLSNNNHLTRDEIITELGGIKRTTNTISPVLILMNAELDGIVCSGKMHGKKSTYALLDERVKATNKISKDEALAKLAGKYFKSHGPATIQDFSWWSGLSLTNSRLALELIKPELASFQIEGNIFWFYEASISNENDQLLHLLPAFDEFLISYKDRTASIALEHQPLAFTKNGIFNPVIAINGKVEGTWKRSIKKETVKIEIKPIGSFDKYTSGLITNKAKMYGDFLDLKVEIA
jgi:hypothetical protein